MENTIVKRMDCSKVYVAKSKFSTKDNHMDGVFAAVDSCVDFLAAPVFAELHAFLVFNAVLTFVVFAMIVCSFSYNCSDF